ncbi:sensor histidine kinase [Plebeiibacterium marinum]|uniref:histidine kinase n=1 Tax=Plebeiibacterium marinum TaxID=2992111 RepID=A0AAE3MDW5_9BACT|nr:sensor histidine kinase [Plebeiobacterium marinum]MCW3806066.1 ATP-binding protein [Plebeiobacterium marinum]
MLKYCLTILFLGLLLLADAQYKFTPLETDVGIDMTRSIFRDHRGYVWIGNQRLGLMRYDGYEIRRYLHQHNDTASMSSNAIYCIFEDSKKQLWIGTEDGLNRYVEEVDGFVNYYFKQPGQTNLSSSFINKIAEAPDSTLWVLTQNGLLSYDRGNDKFIYHVNSAQSDNAFTCIDWDSKGRMWCGTNNTNGLYRFNPLQSSFLFFPDAHPSRQVIGKKTLFIDSADNFWYGHMGVGLAKFHPDKGNYDYYPDGNTSTGTNGNIIYDILEVDSINLFIGIDQGGISILNRETDKFHHVTNNNFRYGNIGSNGVYCLHKDYEGIIWVGTSRGGVSFANPKEARFDTYYPMHFAQVGNDQQSYYPSYGFNSCFLEDFEGDIWIGMDGGGVNVFNRKSKKFTLLNKLLDLNLKVVRSLCQDSDGNIWITYWEGKIIKYNPQNNSYTLEEFQPPELVQLSANSYMRMFIDSKKRFWLAYTFGDVACYRPDKSFINQYFIGDSVRYMDPVLYESDDGEIYAASKDGVFLYDEQSDTMHKIVDVDNVVSMDFGGENDIWFGTLGGDLYSCNLEGKDLKKHIIHKNTAGLSIKAVAYVNKQVWISTDAGIVIYHTETHTTSAFDKNDGLHGNNFFMQSVLKANDGQLFFGGDNGFSAFYPEKMHSNDFVPPVYITDLYLSSEKKSLKDSILSRQRTEFVNTVELDWKSKLKLEFRFVAINLTFPVKNQYKFMLEGFDSSWNDASPLSRKAVYTNLNPGEYVFRVKASNNDGLWNEEGAGLSLIINPPFWKTTWFVAIEVLIVFILLYSFILHRERKMIRDKMKLQEKVTQRTKQIEEQKETLDKQNRLLEQQNDELESKQEELQVQNEELNRHRNHLQELVDEQTEDLIEAKEKAEESERLKSSFLANMSHEIRTPMNAIIGFSTLLTTPEISDDEKETFVPMIRDNSEVLLHLVEDILDFSLIESNQIKINCKEFNLNDLIENVFANFVFDDKVKGLDLRLKNTVESEELHLFSDEYRIRQILSNLMSNALKFTQKGFVELGSRKKDGMLELYVKDSGVGMTVEEQEVIFRQFVKLQKDQYSNIRGIGLGLSISKRLADLLHGQLSVFSKKDVGSEFVLTLPVEKLPS